MREKKCRNLISAENDKISAFLLSHSDCNLFLFLLYQKKFTLPVTKSPFTHSGHKLACKRYAYGIYDWR